MFEDLLRDNEVKLSIQHVLTDVELRVLRDGVGLEREVLLPGCAGDFENIKLLGFQGSNQRSGFAIHHDSCPLIVRISVLKKDAYEG